MKSIPRRRRLTSKMAGIPVEPACLEDEEGKDTATCPVCANVLQQPTSGCPEGHALCRNCYFSCLAQKKECPICRHPTDYSK